MWRFISFNVVYTGRAVVSAGLWVALVEAVSRKIKRGLEAPTLLISSARGVNHHLNARAYRGESGVEQALPVEVMGHRQTAGRAIRTSL